MWKQQGRTLVNGPWVIREGIAEDMLAALYLDAKVHGRLAAVFPAEEPSLREFIGWYSHPAITYSAWYEHPDSDVALLAGLGFTNSITAYSTFAKAEVGVMFTEGMGAPQQSVFRRINLAKGLITALFVLGDVESAYATIPEPNTGALALAGRIGLRTWGPVPNYCAWNDRPVGAYIVQMDAPTWLNRPECVVELG